MIPVHATSTQVFHLNERLDWNYLDQVLAGGNVSAGPHLQVQSFSNRTHSPTIKR